MRSRWSAGRRSVRAASLANSPLAGRARLGAGLANLLARRVHAPIARGVQGRRSAAPWHLPALHSLPREGCARKNGTGCTRTSTDRASGALAYTPSALDRGPELAPVGASPARLNARLAWQPRSARHAVETGSLTAFNHGSDRTSGRADGSAGASAAYEFRRTVERPHPWRPGIVPGIAGLIAMACRSRTGRSSPRAPAPTSSAVSRRAGRCKSAFAKAVRKQSAAGASRTFPEAGTGAAPRRDSSAPDAGSRSGASTTEALARYSSSPAPGSSGNPDVADGAIRPVFT